MARPRHDFGEESFYVLEGRVRFVVGDAEEIAGPGGLVRVPPATPHSFAADRRPPRRARPRPAAEPLSLTA
jgi:mannose-6-phosphate isomerase-like protein (cupin superfamily)